MTAELSMFARLYSRRAVVISLVVVFAVAGMVTLALHSGSRAPGTVSYRGREYINGAGVSLAEVNKRWAPLRDAHTRGHRMEIFVPASQLAPDFSPTVVLLRRSDGTFAIYELSGGP
jgi:hypothetical protein